MVSLDSWFLVDLPAGHPPAVPVARELEQTGETRYLTPPAASEVLIGGYRFGGVYLERTFRLVDSLPMLPFDRQSYREAGRLGAELLKRGTPLGQADLFVAAITMRHDGRLLSRDPAFSRVPGLAVQAY